MWEMSSGSTLQELVLRFGRASWTRLLDYGRMDIVLSTCGMLPGPSTTGRDRDVIAGHHVNDLELVAPALAGALMPA